MFFEDKNALCHFFPCINTIYLDANIQLRLTKNSQSEFLVEVTTKNNGKCVLWIFIFASNISRAPLEKKIIHVKYLLKRTFSKLCGMCDATLLNFIKIP